MEMCVSNITLTTMSGYAQFLRLRGVRHDSELQIDHFHKRTDTRVFGLQVAISIHMKTYFEVNGVRFVNEKKKGSRKKYNKIRMGEKRDVTPCEVVPTRYNRKN
jgi:hypothetical protein